MDRQLQHLLCGTFLHDIGKVMQRAEVLVTEETKNFMAQAGPSFNGTSSHFHVQWTSEFMENHKLNFFLDPDIPFDDHCSQLAFKHHNPSTPLQQIVAEADRLSSGMDREETNNEKGIHKKKENGFLVKPDDV